MRGMDDQRKNEGGAVIVAGCLVVAFLLLSVVAVGGVWQYLNAQAQIAADRAALQAEQQRAVAVALHERAIQAQQDAIEARDAALEKAGRENTERDEDDDALQGTWTVEVHDTHGKPASKEFLALEHQWVFTKDGITMKATGGEGRKGRFQLDQKQDPKTLDITLEPGLPPGPKAPVPGKEVLKCIYSLDGDTLKVCYGLSEDRPVAFKSTAEHAIGLVVLRRQPPPKEKKNKD